MRVLVTGGRTFLDEAWLFAGLDLLDSMAKITEIIEGGAPGADIRARWWAERHQVPVHEVRADWDRHGRSAGPIRNVAMAELKPDVVLACPGGGGTAHMVKTAQARGLRVVFLEKMPLVRATRSHPEPLAEQIVPQLAAEAAGEHPVE